MGGKLEALRGESLRELESDAVAEVKISYSTDTKCFLRAWHLNKTEKALASLGLTCARGRRVGLNVIDPMRTGIERWECKRL